MGDDDIYIEKNKRIKDNGMLKAIRSIGYCELCGSNYRLECHHIKSKASGGGDIAINLICLCTNCHRTVHDGNVARDKLREIAYRREGLVYVR